AGLERTVTFARVRNPQAELGARAQPFLDQMAEMRKVDHDVAETGGGEAPEVTLDERGTANLEERFRHGGGQRGEAAAAAGRQDHRFHRRFRPPQVDGWRL